MGKTPRALEVLGAAHQRQPADRAVLYALAPINRDRGEQAQARERVAKLLELDPADQQARQLLDSLPTVN